jgi:hypothetical protein
MVASGVGKAGVGWGEHAVATLGVVLDPPLSAGGYPEAVDQDDGVWWWIPSGGIMPGRVAVRTLRALMASFTASVTWWRGVWASSSSGEP